MKFDELLAIVDDEPLFETGLLLVGQSSPAYLRRQLSGWVSIGRLWQVRRGLYALAPPHQRIAPHPFYVANRLMRGSYVSLQRAGAFATLADPLLLLRPPVFPIPILHQTPSPGAGEGRAGRGEVKQPPTSCPHTSSACFIVSAEG